MVGLSGWESQLAVQVWWCGFWGLVFGFVLVLAGSGLDLGARMGDLAGVLGRAGIFQVELGVRYTKAAPGGGVLHIDHRLEITS